MEKQTDISVFLADLIAQRDRLNTAIEALQALNTGTTIITGTGSLNASGASVGGNGYVIRSDEFFGMTVLDGAKKFLAMAKRPQNARAVTEALRKGGYLFASENPIATVASVLNRALEGTDIVRTGKGMFGLSEWYPGRPRKPRQGIDGDEMVKAVGDMLTTMRANATISANEPLPPSVPALSSVPRKESSS